MRIGPHPSELHVSTKDEVGVLSGSFYSVTAKLRGMIDALKTVSAIGSLTSETRRIAEAAAALAGRTAYLKAVVSIFSMTDWMYAYWSL